MALNPAPYASRIADESGIGHARRAALVLAGSSDLNETEAGKLAIAVTEAASNLLKHAGAGEILLRQIDGGVEMLALDAGPGIANVGQAMEDGRSTAGTNGIGLGAISRMASLFDIFSTQQHGTAVLAQFRASDPEHREQPKFQVGAAQAPYPGETECGDAWDMRGDSLFVADGLGHGAMAAAAGRAAVQGFQENFERPPGDAMEAVHTALRSTRGAAAAIAAIDTSARTVRFCGIGNISGTIVDRETHGLMSHNGIAGQEPHKITELRYPFPDRALLVMHSDGISGKWNLDAYPGLALRHPSLIAGILFRDFRRQRDDATVVVVKEAAPLKPWERAL